MRKLSIAALAAGLLAMTLLAGCGGGGGSNPSGGAGNPPPPANTGLAITGRIVSTQNNQGIANVQIALGNPAATATTNSNGNFTLYLPEGKTVLNMFTIPTYVFRVDSSSAGANYPVTTPVINASGDSFDQDSVEVPMAVVAGLENSLGTYKLVYFDPGGGPPPPP